MVVVGASVVGGASVVEGTTVVSGGSEDVGSTVVAMATVVTARTSVEETASEGVTPFPHAPSTRRVAERAMMVRMFVLMSPIVRSVRLAARGNGV